MESRDPSNPLLLEKLLPLCRSSCGWKGERSGSRKGIVGTESNKLERDDTVTLRLTLREIAHRDQQTTTVYGIYNLPTGRDQRREGLREKEREREREDRMWGSGRSWKGKEGRKEEKCILHALYVNFTTENNPFPLYQRPLDSNSFSLELSQLYIRDTRCFTIVTSVRAAR